MKIRAFGVCAALLLGLALIIPAQAFAQDEPEVFTGIDIQDDPIIVGVDTTFDVDISWATVGAWSYTEVYVGNTLYGCFDTPNQAGLTSGTVTVTLPVQGALLVPGDYTLFMFQANNSSCNDVGNTLAVTACLIGGFFSVDLCPNDDLEVANQATVTVTKTFSDDNPAVVPIALECTDTNAVITVDDGNADITDTAEFTVTGYVDGTTCTATENGVPAGYTPDESACVDLELVSGEDSPCTIDNQQDPVTVTITKDFTVDHPTADLQASITLTCPSATVDGGTSTATKTTTGFTASFEVSDFPYDGEDCEATETVPAGYVQSSATGCDELTVTPGATGVGCTIINRPTEAVFAVDKNYSDTNPVLAAVVTPTCTDAGGGPGVTYSATSGNALHGTNFTTTVRYFAGATNCTASEADQVGYSFVAGSSTCDEGVAITDVADGTCVLFNQQDPVTILASKEYTSGGATATFDASCTAGTVTDIKTDASAGSPAEFEVSNFPYNGTTCDVTEPTPPDGYYQVASTCDDLSIVPSDSDTLCTITNAPTRATFEVTKEFTDGDNPTEVEVTINCFTGLPLQQSQDIDETQGVEFVVTDFDSGELDCEITEEGLNGYTATYESHGPGDYDSNGGCNFYDVEGGAENTCHIRNDADPVDVEIEKLWVIEGSGGDAVDTGYKLTLWCDAPIDDPDQCYGGPSLPVADVAYYCKEFHGDSSSEFVAHVTPEYPSSNCWVDEQVYDDAVEIDNDCGSLVISAGNGASCLITNTVFFEGIPTLNQYGMALLALLMLGVGLVGFRRFA